MVVTRSLGIKTSGNTDVINITPQVVRELGLTKVRNGVVVVFVIGSTAGITTIEFEPALVSDFKDMWDRAAPRNMPYQHDNTWGDANGFSHVRASLLGPSLTVPIVDGVLTLGEWQQIVLIDFDHRSRSREIIVQAIGE